MFFPYTVMLVVEGRGDASLHDSGGVNAIIIIV